MDPVALAFIASGLGAGLVTAFNTLVGKGLAEPLAEKGFEPLRELLSRGYDKKRDEAKLSAALQAALEETSGSAEPNDWARHRWVTALEALKADPDLAARVAAAAVEMKADEPARVPPDLVNGLNLSDDQRAPLATFLFRLRKELVSLPGYGDGIRHADDLHASSRLDGLYELVAGLAETVAEAGVGKALRVQVVPPDTSRQEREYLRYLQRVFGGLSLAGRPGAEGDAVAGVDDLPLRLERVYIALNTTELHFIRDVRGKRLSSITLAASGEVSGTMRLSALHAVMESRRLVLLGDPGSGKSTLAHHLCLCLAGARLNPAGDWAGRLITRDIDRWTLPFYFPIFVRLRAFGADTASLPEDIRVRGQARHLLAHIQSDLAGNGWEELAGHVLELLEGGQAFILLDGLDEVTHPNPPGDPTSADAARREQVSQAIADFSRFRFAHARVLVTCRVRQYPLQPPAPWALPGFPAATLAQFDRQQVREFVNGWFEELSARGPLKGDPAEKRRGLIAALESRPELEELAPQPIVLTQMALLHAHRELPGSRIGVYDECARLLLWDWDRLKAEKGGRRGEGAEDFLRTLHVPGLRLPEVQTALDEAVYYAHDAGEAEISGDRLRRHLRQTFEVYELPQAEALRVAHEFIVGWLRGRNSLIVPASGDDSFDVPHRTFREFLAGRYLRENTLTNPSTGEPERWEHSSRRLVESDQGKWREVVRFAAGLATAADVATALIVLCPESVSPDLRDAWKVTLAGEIARDADPAALRQRRNPIGNRVLGHLERQLLHLMRDTAEGDYPNDPRRFSTLEALPPKTRLEAGLLLDSLGWTPPDLSDFITVAVGNTRFAISRYLVTNLQYKRFLDAKDYADSEIWKSVIGFDAEGQPQDIGDEAWSWFQRASKEGKREPGLWDQPRFGAARRLLPVVGVTWYEAAAYCAWLQRHRSDADVPEGHILPDNLVFRLPLEGEWTATAGGAEDDRYPWGDDPNVQYRANTRESDFDGTSPVCMYPAGMSPSGVMDMGGNVWEWLANLHKQNEPYRAVRGGSWNYLRDYARAAARDWYAPGYIWDLVGLRVVAAPG